MKKTVRSLFSFRNAFLTGCLLLLSLTGIAQTHYYVSASGSNTNNGLTPASAKQTIPAAVSIAMDGDVIHLANGTYALTATLNLNHELTIIGESEAGVIINATGTPASAWAINPNKSNTSLSNFTVIPNGGSGGFPIHAGSNSTPVQVITNLGLSHITINGAKKTAFDFNGITNLSVSYLTATNTTGGNGVQVSGCWNVTADHIITTNNAWGGFAVYVSKISPGGVGRGSNGINIDATTCSFSEVQSIYSQDEAGFFSTNININGYDYAVQNPNAAGYTYYFNNKTSSLAFAGVLPVPGASTVKQLSTGNFITGTGMKIQTAVNAAAANGTVLIEPGTYHEDVTINKTLTLKGSGIDASIVSGVSGGGSASFQVSANGVVIDGFTITRDGNTLATWNDPLNTAGIAIQTVGNAEIRNCKFVGNRTAIDINNSNGNHIHNNLITDNRSGIVFRNRTDQTSVTENTITNNWTVGILFLDASGGTNTPVQSAANSSFSNNNISGNWYGQIVDRQAGGSLPSPGSNPKNFTCNWYGSVNPVFSTNDSGEPGYAAQIPVAYGGSAVPPGGKPDIAGPAAANFVYTPYLINGTDNDATANGFQPVPNSCASPLSNVQLATTAPALCYGGTGTATISYTNGIGTVSYTVDGGTVVVVTGSPFTVSGLSARQHSILVSDNTGSSSTVTATIAGPSAALQVNFVFTPIQCNGGMSTQNVTITGGTAPYTMTNQGGGAFILGAQEGVTYGGNAPNTFAANYTYTVTDANGCSYTFNANITQPDPITVQYNATPILCNGGLSTESITINGGTAPYTVTNQGGGVLVDGAQSGVTYHGNTYAANYTYTVTDAHGCSYTFTTSITQPAALQAAATATAITCNGNSAVTVTATGGKAPYSGTGSYSVTAGTYTYMVTDANGCSATVSVTPQVIPDTEKPVVTAPMEYSVVNSPGQCGAILNSIGAPIVSDNCGIANITNNHPSTYYPIGTTIVTWIVTDQSGNVNDTAKQKITVIDNEFPQVTYLPGNQVFCTSGSGSYNIPQLQGSDNCGSPLISYQITGATSRSGNGNDASGQFAVGVSTIKWKITDAVGFTVYATTSVTVNPLPATTIAVSDADAFCNKLTLTAASVANVSYNWSTGAATQSISLGQLNGDGVYSVTVTANGCTSAPANYVFAKQNLVSSYTILALKDIDLGENNIVGTGSVGITDPKGEASFRKNSSVSSPGSFVKAKYITKNGSNINISNPVYSAASGIVLPTMLLNTANTNNLPNKDVAQNSVSTVNGNYKNLTLKKGSRTLLTGNTFGTIRVEQGAQVTFTASTINIDKLQIVKGPRYGYSYVRFAGDAKVVVSGSVTIGSQVYINPDNYKVTFYLGDKKSDDEQFTVKGGDTKVTANIYLPNGKLKVTGGYSYGDYGNGRGDCDRDDDDDRYYGQGNSYVNMTGVFIAEEIEGNGKNVIWNNFECGSAPVPVLNTNQSVVTQTTSEEKGIATSEEELKVTVLPNPSSTYFTLKLESRYNTPVNMRVMDSRGRVIDTKTGIGSNSTLQVGHHYANGTYYAELIQGGVRKTVQLLKIRN
ncbi:MAG: right-handed parallel beta-helix repeat-containing protein [Bacteroidota bacterium]